MYYFYDHVFFSKLISKDIVCTYFTFTQQVIDEENFFHWWFDEKTDHYNSVALVNAIKRFLMLEIFE